ncbi:MAG: YceI family protein, partial [Proteobacteria bacterium]|nr:YceI family protein [Pseudomonadota bacterium]
RDEHMQKYLDSEHFPTAKFVVTLLPWSDPSEALVKAVEAAPFEGKMTLHGVEKPIKGTMSSKLEAQGKVNFTFVFELNIVDFGIAVPSYLGVTVKEVVGVTVNSSAKLEAL